MLWRECTLQWHAMVLNTTGTTYTRQQPIDTLKERRIRKTKNEKRKHTIKFKYQYYMQKQIPWKATRIAREDQREAGEKHHEPEPGWIRNEVVPHRKCDKQHQKTKQTKKKGIIKNSSPPLKTKKTRLTRQKNHGEKHKSTKLHSFEAAAAVCGTSGIDRFYLLVSLAPCHIVCRLLPAFVNRVFRTSSTAVVLFVQCPPRRRSTDDKKQHKYNT